MAFTKNLERLKTLPRKRSIQTFNAPGVYFPEYGRTTHFISGKGTPGSPPTGGNPDGGSNPSTPAIPATRNWRAVESGYETGVPAYYFSYTYYGESPGPAPAPYTNHPSSNVTWYTNFTFLSSNPSTPAIPSTPNYNSFTPGSDGAPAVVLGVPFPGGTSGTSAPTVNQTFVALSYTGTGINITVPSGGYVSVENK